MSGKLSDEIEYAAKETVENLCNALTEFSKSCAIASKALGYYYIILLERSASLAYEQYLYAKATTKILCERYYGAKWYNKWYHKRKYFKAIKAERKLRELYNLNKTTLAKAKENLMDGLTEPSKSLDYWLKSTK
jgi:hypothetical protein